MKLLIPILLLAVGVGLLLGGHLRNLGSLSIRWAPLAIAGLVLQVINPPGSWPVVMLDLSFVLLAVFAIVNRDIPGFRLIMVGVALNFLVIAANGGMPVSGHALTASGQADTRSDLTNDADRYVKHHLAGDDDTLVFLGDVIPIPPPVSQAISVGDVFTYGGVAVVIVAAMRRRHDVAPVGASGVAPVAAGEGGGPHGR